MRPCRLRLLLEGQVELNSGTWTLSWFQEQFLWPVFERAVCGWRGQLTSDTFWFLSRQLSLGEICTASLHQYTLEQSFWLSFERPAAFFLEGLWADFAGYAWFALDRFWPLSLWVQLNAIRLAFPWCYLATRWPVDVFPRLAIGQSVITWFAASVAWSFSLGMQLSFCQLSFRHTFLLWVRLK